MTKNYKGYEIRTYETLGIGMGSYFEAWKDDQMMAFAKSEESLKMVIDQMEKEAE